MAHPRVPRSGGKRPARDRARLLAQEGDRQFQKNQKTEEAQRLYDEALRLDPDCPEALASYGYFLVRLGRQQEAEQCYRHALEVRPKFIDAQVRLGLLYVLQAKCEQAIEVFQEALADHPDSGNLQVHLADACWGRRRMDEAAAALDLALQKDPALEAEVCWRRARILYSRQEYEPAAAEARRAIQIAPSLIGARLVLANALEEMGQIEESIEVAREAVRVCPGYIDHHTALLFRMNYHPRLGPEEMYREARRWEKECVAPLVRGRPVHHHAPEPERRLRIGYVSPDLREHSIARFVAPILEHHDRSQVEVFAYHVNASEDQTSAKLRTTVDHWRRLPECNGEDLAGRIRSDRIDILVDLAGHSGSILHAFALKPSPVQVSWMGLLGTTGLSAMDYFFGDPWMPAPGTEHCFSEKVFRLPRATACYRPVNPDVPVSPAPCLARGAITFGSFNNPKKIHREVVRLWSAILHLVPGSRLLLKYVGMETDRRQRQYRGWFAEDGIDPSRIEFQGPSSTSAYLASYGEIDIGLDPFPYNGGTTTLDALWMGVPVVSLAGRTAVQRGGATLLGAAGLEDFVAATPEQYLKTALFLAGSVATTPDLRHEIRKALRSSAWMDEAGITRDVEQAYRQMWRDWCRTRSGASAVVAEPAPAIQ